MYLNYNMNDNEINDIRISKDFKGMTFSKFKRSEVKKLLIKELFNENLEQSQYWSVELICTGCYMDLWEIIILFISKYIHLGNPKLPTYIEMRFNNFKNIVTNGYIGNELAMRNNMKIRNIFAEIITVLCQSPKRHGFDVIKIDKEGDYNLGQLSNRLKAPDTTYGDQVFRKDDPKEIYIATNELAYHLSETSKNLVDACFWIEWIIEYENISRKYKKKIECERRENIPVDQKYQKEIIWIIWDVLFSDIETKTKMTKKIITSLLSLYCLHYSSGCKKRRRYIIYFAVSILVDNYNTNTNIIQNKEVIDKVIGQINVIYKQIKKHEEAPKTEYLFNEEMKAKSNLERTVEKLDKLKEVMGSV